MDRILIEPVGNVGPHEISDAIRQMDTPFIFSAWGYGATRYTFAGAAPFIVVRTDARGATVVRAANQVSKPKEYKDPLDAISRIIDEFGPATRGPFPFNGGMAGYFAYGLKDYIAGPAKGALKSGRPASRGQDPGLPCCIAGFYDTIYVYDHSKETAFIVTIDAGRDAGFKRGLRDAMLRGAGPPASRTAHYPPPPGPPPEPKEAAHARAVIKEYAAGLCSNTTRAEHIGAIQKALEYIAAGDIYQINLSHRLEVPWPGEALELYLSLITKKPAPFSSYMDFDAFSIISNSPERLLRVTGNIAETEPIKGTRPRGATPKEDRALMAELRESVKERAEHVMIVDLERNDLGRVCMPGSVAVTEFEKIKTLPGLHHMVSTVRGTLAPGSTSIDCLRAAFPGGSVTGAPKIRAMEIIEELEKAPRSIYTGGIGWIDWSGDMDISMAIRTAVHRGSTLYLSVGGGIVADSIPEDEYDETILKAQDFLEVAKADTVF